MGVFASLLPPHVAVAEMTLTQQPPEVFAQEAAAVADAIPRRRLEFAAGRHCARLAMASLGWPAVAILRAPDRVPIWPDGLTGSITHTAEHCAAAIARVDQGIAAIGIDMEPAEALRDELWDTVCLPEERGDLGRHASLSPGMAAMLLFCVKEATFKCQYSLSRTMLDFTDIAVTLDVPSARFLAAFRCDAAPFRCGEVLTGRFAVTEKHIACAVVRHTQSGIG